MTYHVHPLKFHIDTTTDALENASGASFFGGILGINSSNFRVCICLPDCFSLKIYYQPTNSTIVEVQELFEQGHDDELEKALRCVRMAREIWQDCLVENFLRIHLGSNFQLNRQK